MTGIVVSDTSPLRALAHLGRVEWLGQLFGEVVVPTAVALELGYPPARFEPLDLTRFAFISVRPSLNLTRVAYWRQRLDEGEANALALTEELGATTVLIDEACGRALALQAGLTVIGTLGILLRAKTLGLCFEIRTLLDSLQYDLNFFIAPSLREAVLMQADETD